MLNVHQAYVYELKNSFINALNKDRLYTRPVGFMTDQQIWLLGVSARYFLHNVLHFDHTDFMKAIRWDLQPLLSELGLWVLENK